MTICKIENNREAFRELLLLADPEWAVVEKYLYEGEISFQTARTSLAPHAPVRAVRGRNGCGRSACDIPSRRRVRAEKSRCRTGFSSGRVTPASWLYVGTSGPKLYERMGFIRAYTVENFFVDNYSEPVWDEGELLKDMYYLVRDLKEART